jgi:mRNA interferase MazF
VVTKLPYQPERGDLIWLDFTPSSGTEQSGRRPALVLSERAFNVATGLAFVCPVTNKGKGSSFEVPLPAGIGVTGFVLSDHLRSLDWLSRNATFAGKMPPDGLWEVLGRIEAIMGTAP